MQAPSSDPDSSVLCAALLALGVFQLCTSILDWCDADRKGIRQRDVAIARSLTIISATCALVMVAVASTQLCILVPKAVWFSV